MKTVLEVKKNGAKSILGSNPFGKVEGENFSFSACTLMAMALALSHVACVGLSPYSYGSANPVSLTNLIPGNS